MCTYSRIAPPNGYYLDLWRFINVLLLIIIIVYIVQFQQVQRAAHIRKITF